MGGVFGGGGAPSYTPPPVAPPPAPIPAPTIDAARQSQQSQDNVGAKQGRAAGILTSSQGDLSAAPTTKKSLLGS
jgi:hypothetical protein